MRAADSPFVLYAKESQIRSLELDANASTARSSNSFQPVLVSTASYSRSYQRVLASAKVISMDFDSQEGYVYWVQEEEQSYRGTHLFANRRTPQAEV